MTKGITSLLFLCVILSLTSTSCKKKGGSGGSGELSTSTGWEYGNQDFGGFEKLDYEGQINGPNLVLIEGGTFAMGLASQDVTFEWNNIPRRVTVSSFYMDETEVKNIDWKEYEFWTKKTYQSYPQVWKNLLPDTLVWREELSYNEPLVRTYYRHPSYDEYPIVGVSWEQAQEFCHWRSNRVNEMILIQRGVLNPNPGEQVDSESFDSESYLAGQYQGSVRKNLEDKSTGGERSVRFEDGILLPEYRLPTEAEWEYAALALQGNQPETGDENITDRRFFPWNDNTPRYQKHNKNQGNLQANFKRGRGDYMGIAGSLNDAASGPAPVRRYLPNDFGLYNMAGNVNEWTEDVYRQLTSQDLADSQNHDLNPFRGNVYQEVVLDEEGSPVEKDSLGYIRYKNVEDDTLGNRDNYRKSDVRNFEDGDNQELVDYGYGQWSLINDKSRVIKGGSWADRLFWLQPSTRRYMDQFKSDSKTGFRCAMVRVGGEAGNEDSGGLEFKEKGKKVKRRYK